MGDTKSPQNKIVIIGLIVNDSNKTVGYRVFDLGSNKVQDVKSDAIEQNAQYILGASYDNKYKSMISTCDVSLSSLPKIDANTRRIKARGGLLLKEIFIDNNKDIIGALVYDTNGARGAIKYDNLLNLVSSSGNCVPINFSIDTDASGRRNLSVLDMGFIPKRRVLDEYKKTSFRVNDSQDYISKTGVVKEEGVSAVPVYSLSEASMSAFNQDANQILLRATTYLKVLAPYYYVLLSTLKKRPCTQEVSTTMGVTEDTIYYNTAFISSCTVGEVIFILMHEVMHVAMMHSARHGKRDHKLWNVATDLYINEMLVHDFNLIPGTEVQIKCKDFNGNMISIGITAPIHGLYFSKIGEVCNLSKDFPEAIYSRLSKQQQKQKCSGSGDDNSGSNSNGGGNGEMPDLSDSDEVEIYYNGKKLEGVELDDIKSNVGHDTDDNKKKSQEQAMQKVQDMATKKRMVEEKTGKELTQGMTGCEIVQRIIEYNLMGNLDWRQVLKNIVSRKPSKRYTLASPNEAYMNMGVTLADRRRIGKPEELKGIVICIDVSGSIDDKTLSFFYNEVANIFKYYKADCGLLYWNTRPCEYGHFSNKAQLKEINSDFTGGTDAKCIFDFLTGKSKTSTGKEFDMKAKDIKAVIVITDGCFTDTYSEQYKEAFDRKTYWLLYGTNPVSFNAGFGKAMLLKQED